jgi:hypothetical protein
MSRSSTELATHIAALAIEVEVIERATYRRRMSHALELELITMRREIGAMKGLI